MRIGYVWLLSTYIIYAIVIFRYEHDIQVISQDPGKAKVAGDDFNMN